jgi:hypothetical protein
MSFQVDRLTQALIARFFGILDLSILAGLAILVKIYFLITLVVHTLLLI